MIVADNRTIADQGLLLELLAASRALREQGASRELASVTMQIFLLIQHLVT